MKDFIGYGGQAYKQAFKIHILPLLVIVRVLMGNISFNVF